MLIDLSCPVENRGTTVKTNSETGEQYLLLKLVNISEKTITALNFNLKAFDENGVEICVMPIELTDLSADPKTFFAENKAISLNDIPDAKNFIIDITSAIFEDGDTYEPSLENTVEFNNAETSIENALLLRNFIPEAVCFAEEKDNHWRCVCGRPNFLDSSECIRCGNKKDEVLTKFSSWDSLQETIKAVEFENEQLAIKEAEEKELLLKAKKAKIKKTVIITLVTIFTLAILAVIGFFGRNLYFNLAADNAAKSGDYLKAYELYSKTGSKKIGEIGANVKGNTFSNLISNGFATEDENYFYFFAYDSSTGQYNLIKENKKTNETSILTDTAIGLLNSVGDYIYYINNEGKIWRTSKDGKQSELIVDKLAYMMTVVGTDIYYLTPEYDNPNNLTEEQCELLASQGQLETFYRIHKYNIVSKKDKTVSEENISSFDVHNDRIFFTTYNENPSENSILKSMTLKGKDIKTVVDVPVYSFEIKGNDIYYIKLFNSLDDITSNEYAYSLAKTDLISNTVVDLLPGSQVFNMNFSNDNLIYISLNNLENTDENADDINNSTTFSINSTNFETGVSKVLVSGDLRIFNVAGDTIFGISDNGMFRLKVDGTGFEPIYADGTSNPPVNENDLTEETAE